MLEPNIILNYILARKYWFLYKKGKDEYYLTGLAYKDPWPFRKEMTGRHIITDPINPQPTFYLHDFQISCSCGIHAFKMNYHPNDYLDINAIIGIVALWGRVIEHENGYRAEFAYPQELSYFLCANCYHKELLINAHFITPFTILDPLRYLTQSPTILCSDSCVENFTKVRPFFNHSAFDTNHILNKISDSYGVLIRGFNDRNI